MKRSQASTVAIATKTALFLAPLIGCSSLSAAPEVCVLAPALDAMGSTEAPQALVPLSRPTLFVREPLAELRIEQGARLLWSWQSRLGEALEGPLAWPLPPFTPEQTYAVRLRPLGVTADHFATIQLVGAQLQRLKEGDGLLHALVRRPETWQATITKLLNRGDRSLAAALLFAREGPDEPGLNDLRRLVAQESCR